MDKKLNGLVLKAVSYGEKDKILTILTLEEGLVSAKIKGVKGAGAKLKFASEPFCFAEFLFAETGDKKTVTGASIYDGFYPLREDINKFYAGMTVLEFCLKFCLDLEPSPEIFEKATEALSALAYSDKQPSKILVEFLLSGLKYSGYYLNTQTCFYCECEIDGRVFFQSSSGGFLCLDCVGETGMEVSRFTYGVLKKVDMDEELTEEENAHILRALKLLDFYMEDRAETSLKALKDFISL